jgi:Xaa-Pro aminopeptidase
MTFTSPIPGNEMKPPGEIFFDQRKRAYLNPEGADRPLKSPIPHDTLVKARQYRLQRLRAKLQEFDCAAILLYSPINIRYALDVTNIQVWTAHDAMRYALIFADGPAIMFEFKGCHPAFVRPGWRARVCEAGMARIYENSLPGRSEQELWAELHYENARSGGEWLETRLLTCGARTNPWYQECSDYVCQQGEMISFDTDMIGPYGYCADLSRSWTCGYTPMTAKQSELYSAAVEQISHNLEIIEPGMSFREFNAKSWQIPQKYQPYRYSLAAHGVGMADEWPVIPLHPDFETAGEGHFEENMVLCVESLIGEKGSESVKLEVQVVVRDRGIERLDSFPFEEI